MLVVIGMIVINFLFEIMQDKLQKAMQILARAQVPNLPEELIRLQNELNLKYPNTVNVANIISHNPEILSDFMNLVNTNLTDEKQEIKDAKAAVNVLGLDEIYNIFLSAALTNLLAQSPTEKKILTQSAMSGLAAAELSYWVYDVTRSEAYMAGLMQNIGAIYFARAEPEFEDFFDNQLGNPISGFKNEDEHFGTNHAVLGTVISKKWNIEPDVYKAILFHHDADFGVKATSHQKIKHLIALIVLGNYVVSVSSGDQYITKELKEYRKLGERELDLPDNALKAGIAAVAKWGDKIGSVTA